MKQHSLLLLLLSCALCTQAQSPAASLAATDPALNAGAPSAPLPQELEAYPEYEVSEVTERTVDLTPSAAAAIILDYSQQCKTCPYPVASVVSQEVFERDDDPYRFLVWQDVNKEISVLVGKIPFRSSSWTQVRVFESPDRRTIVIDSRLLTTEAAAAVAEQYDRPSEPAFAILHSRWTISAQDADKAGRPSSLIQGIAGGKGQGISNLVPASFMRKELKAVMDETLDFVAPSPTGAD